MSYNGTSGWSAKQFHALMIVRPVSRQFVLSQMLTITVFQCLQLTLFDLPMAHTTQGLSPRTELDDALWACRNADDWAACKLQTTSKEIRASPSSQYLYVVAGLTYERERKFQNAYFSSHLKPMRGHCLPARNFTQSTIPDTILSEMQSILEETMSRSIQQVPPIVPGLLDKPLFHVLSIIRHIPLQSIYAFSGWRASNSEIIEAGLHLKNWIESKPRTLRICLWHAGSVFRILRDKVHLSCFEPFALLIATLLIWTCCMLGPLVAAADRQDSTVRIDRLVNQLQIQQWLEQEKYLIHLTGVGTVFGYDGAQRLMLELSSLLRTKLGWPGTRLGLAYCAEQVMSGQLPQAPEEQE